MTSEPRFPRRLIEVDLPIKEISAHARREKDMRRAHVPLLYIWPATRPPAACRAVLLGALLPDPADEQCPESFKRDTIALLRELREKRGGTPRDWQNPQEVQRALLDFIA